MNYAKQIIASLFLLATASFTAKAQLYKIELASKVKKASHIVEGKVTAQYSFWNDAHTIIYTSNKIHVYKLFKGQAIDSTIEVLTLGGTVGATCLKVSDVLQLDKGKTGIFFLHENTGKIRSPQTKNILFDVYSSAQGFLQYNKSGKKAVAPFASYNNIQQTLYKSINKYTGTTEKIIDNAFASGAAQAETTGPVISNGTTAVAITSFSPDTVHGGAINDEANNILTITGSGFGSSPSGDAAVNFKDANSDNTEPDYEVAYSSPYIISWTDTQIKLHVPDRAGTGQFSVVTTDGSTATSAATLEVFFSVIDALFQNDDGDYVVKEPRLMNTNSSGGYTVQYSTSTAGKGINLAQSSASATFERALATWKEITGANITVGATTTQQAVADDDVNLVVFDNTNTGVAQMADGVLESTYSWFSACQQNGQILAAQKTGFDIIIRNDAVSTGDALSIEDGPCFPAQGSYDLEMIILHELGHALNLSHINDDFENGGGGYTTINPSKLMHYAILDYVGRRSPDISAYDGALYDITPQQNTYGSCSLYAQEMTPISVTALSTDECPSTFPSSSITANTIVSFDLVHATSNKLKDPSFKQVTCDATGTSVTNNVYYAFSTGSETEVTIDISNYTTVPAELSACTGQGIKMSLYDVETCPEASSYPTPVFCSTFNADGTIDITGLEKNHKYLLYFDGVRNTKATFYATFNADGSNQGIQTTIDIAPNPLVSGYANITITNTTGSYYQYSLFDAVGKQVLAGKLNVTSLTQTFTIAINNSAAGVYFLRVADENGKTVIKKKLIKYN
ncbi:zinc-dependent metalloprotease [Parafilimonas sp.]|uniref:zinc-dependent metalloprotease n=1 Tax=Parafilimonas sp. TaxID=1969739 RepID=UPI0039E220D3